VGLPLVNQALLRENPRGDDSFLVTVRSLLKVLAEIPARSVIEALKEANKPKPPPPDRKDPVPVTPPPTISASTEGAGSSTILVVNGSGFLPGSTVTIRVVDEQFSPERNFQFSSTATGVLSARVSLPCNSGLPFHVSATDSRPGEGILGVVFSNNVTLSCP